ncbi:Glyoxalase/Bleomycin resistance protein/Dihydroxybiphenyl dioxygenase [Aspergillus carlsbadensis]|nr:Glyoxalase/Bleomycin resistance protein/Dihydroxybiphenyl dioxygenase [Aspergillus carlsbadensis]
MRGIRLWDHLMIGLGCGTGWRLEAKAVHFNHGASIDDVVAIGPDQEPLAAWKERSLSRSEPTIHLVKLSHMRYQHPDPDEITTFLQDFGMSVAKRTDSEVWYRGYGEDQYVYYARKGPKQYLGGTFQVRARRLPHASEIQELGDAPGGGHLLTFSDPEGFPVNLIFGQIPAVAGTSPAKLTYNYETEKPRIRRFQRFEPGPAGVHKLGHFGLCTTNLTSLITFYTNNFNLVPSDFLYIEKEDNQRTNVALFAHIDLGPEYVDHHCFFISSNATSHVHHCSFEVHDFDTQKLGHQWLASKGYKSVWGVGRHILGSQIFDYWWDTTGNMIEHYADGDLVNDQTPVGYGPAGDESLAVWGPEVPAWFLQ